MQSLYENKTLENATQKLSNLAPTQLADSAAAITPHLPVSDMVSGGRFDVFSINGTHGYARLFNQSVQTRSTSRPIM